MTFRSAFLPTLHHLIYQDKKRKDEVGKEGWVIKGRCIKMDHEGKTEGWLKASGRVKEDKEGEIIIIQ